MWTTQALPGTNSCHVLDKTVYAIKFCDTNSYGIFERNPKTFYDVGVYLY